MAEIKRKSAKKKSTGAFIRDSFMTGVSYMIPVIVGGCVLQAIAKLLGGYNIGAEMANIDSFAKVIYLIGSSLWSFTVPVIAAFTAYAMADKPGLAPGFAVGAIANTINAGYLGGILGGFLVGYFVMAIKKVNVPKDFQGIMSIIVIPVVSTLVCGMLMYYVIGRPIAWFMSVLQAWLISLSSASRFLLGAVIGAGMCVDYGGPIGKSVSAFTNGLNAEGLFVPTSAKMCSGMTAPLGIAIATFLGGKKKFSDDDRENAKSALYLSCCYIEEACIPFLIKDPVRVILSTAIGGALTGGLCLMLSLESPAIHGGVFAIPLTSNPLLFIGLWFLGSVVTGIIYATIKKPLLVEEQES